MKYINSDWGKLSSWWSQACGWEWGSELVYQSQLRSSQLNPVTSTFLLTDKLIYIGSSTATFKKTLNYDYTFITLTIKLLTIHECCVLKSFANCSFEQPKRFHASCLSRKAIPQCGTTITTKLFWKNLCGEIKLQVCSGSPSGCSLYFGGSETQVTFHRS